MAWRVPLLWMAAIGGLAVSANAGEFKSIYVDTDWRDCVVPAEATPPASQRAAWEDQGAGRYVCPGAAGYKMHSISGDAIIGVGFAPEGEIDAVFPLEIFDDYAVANWGKVEWRLRDDKVVAIIRRWFIDRGGSVDGNPENGNVLVIAKVTGQNDPSSCVVGYVDAKANPNANLLAREVADKRATDFVCGLDTPSYHGIVGPTAAKRSVLN